MCKGEESYAEDDDLLCNTCRLTLFQIDEILNSYIEEGGPEPWAVKISRELDFIYNRSLITLGYFNATQEVVFRFIIDGETSFSKDDIDEVNVSSLPRDKILNLLEKGYVISIKDGAVYPGPLTLKLKETRWEGYELDTTEIVLKFQEIRGIITLALTKALIESNIRMPRAAISILSLLSNQILNSEEEIEKEIGLINQQISFGSVTERQERFLKWAIGGVNDGRTRIARDIDDEGNIILKDHVIDYLVRIRKRWREIERMREDRTIT